MQSFVLTLAQINPSVGALSRNADMIMACAARAADSGASLVVFPELAVSGYPPEDLVLKPHFIEDVATQIERIASQLPPELIAVVGAPIAHEGAVYNAAVVLQHGHRQGVYFKRMLPNYGVFDEKRVFAEGTTSLVLGIGSYRIGVHICEDSWSTTFPSVRRLTDANLDALVNLSASPYHRGKAASRRGVLTQTARAVNAPLCYCNLVGGQDELVFDGRSLVIQPDGAVPCSAATFSEDLLLHELPPPRSTAAPKSSNDWNFLPLKVPIIGTFDKRLPISRGSAGAGRDEASESEDLAEVYAALRLGLADYVNKNGFNRVVVAISGGIDSALVVALAVDALGPDRVVGVTMPSKHSSEGTYSDARAIARRLGIEFHDVPIRRLHELYLEELTGYWLDRPPDTTEENLQARIRGTIIMAFSNKFGWLVLTTGNKSEMATGYCTLYGDMAGGFALIKDVPKTLVFALCRWRNAQTASTPPIPPSIIERPPSAELRDNQRDEDSLPPYHVLDAIIERYVERDWAAERIVADGYDAAVVSRVIHLIDSNEYKRRQGPPGVKITPKSFGRDRRLPITNRYHERVKTALR